MIVHMTGLYTRLVTYVRLHILILVSFYHDTSYISFIALLLTIILLYFILVIMLLLLALLCTNTFSFTHTHLVASDDPGFARPGFFGHLLILFRCSCDRTFVRSWSFSLLVLIFLSLLSSCYFQFSMYTRFSLYSSSFI